MPSSDTYRNATREEFNLAVEWAAAEGWNPGLDDANVFWETDPEGFVCVERDGEVIATGSIVSYDRFGFMGFFIVRKDLRNQGIGRDFWHWRKERLQARLVEGGSIGMDGVFDMQPFYAKGGFAFTHRNLRMEGIGQKATTHPSISNLSDASFDAIAAYDQHHFGFARETFLKRWIDLPNGKALGAFDGDRLSGYGVVRKCQNGYKIGPLFADNGKVAENLYVALSSHAAGEPLFLDTPECNDEAMALAERHGLSEVFGCARMYAGPEPALPWKGIFGITTFELG